MKARFSSLAHDNLLVALQHYEAESDQIAADFLDAVHRAANEAGRDPMRFPVYEGRELGVKFRRVLVERFPYILIYRTHNDEVLIAAVAHASREPGYWTKDK